MNIHQHSQPGTKHDTQKPQPTLVLHSMSRAIQAVVDVATFGAGKYSPDNWLHVDDAINRYSNAKQRHMLLGATESRDEESGLLHAAHEAWNALAVLELMLRDAQAAPADPADWEAGEKRMDIIGPNGPTGEHYPETGFIDGYGTIEIGDYLPEFGGYLIGFIDGCGIIMLEEEFPEGSYGWALKTVSDFNAVADSGEFNDWRVPTKDELNLTWINRDRLTELGMSHVFYWSATESAAGIAWCPACGGSGRDGSYRVRPVRTVPVDQLARAKE